MNKNKPDCKNLEKRYQHVCKHSDYNVYKESKKMNIGLEHICSPKHRLKDDNIHEISKHIDKLYDWYIAK